MKKLLSLALALTLVCGFAASAQAVTWGEPSAAVAAAPISIEVVKLGINRGVTGGEYYTVLEDGAAYPYSTVYYAVKLVLPSYEAVNANYNTTEFYNGSKLSVSLSYTNLSSEVKTSVDVYLSERTQTLWYNKKNKAFEESWVPSVSNNCGCGDAHILSSTTANKGEVSVKACLSYTGKLEAVRLKDGYTIEKKTFYGVRPCLNCPAVNLEGFAVNSDCAANGVFFTVDKTDKVTGVYVFANGACAVQDTYEGAMIPDATTLYHWVMAAPVLWCAEDPCPRPTFELVELNRGQPVRRDGVIVNPQQLIDPALFTQYCDQFKVAANLRDWNLAYYKSDDVYKPWSSLTYPYYRKGISPGNTEIIVTDKEYYMYLANPGTTLEYGNIYVKQAADTGSHLFRMLSAQRVDCDDGAQSFLNSANRVLEIMGFTFADVEAGTIYMTTSHILANFGLYISVCDTATWNEYTASITTLPVAEVPATGAAVCAGGLLLCAGACAAASIRRKRR
ncbi:MAG: hypothetical protein Q4E65_07485 [Clostridia bacterium]|nr:hypothetical protein [Clostridia bacterium]